MEELEGMKVEAAIAQRLGNLEIQNIAFEVENHQLKARIAELERAKPLDVVADEDLLAVDGHKR